MMRDTVGLIEEATYTTHESRTLGRCSDKPYFRPVITDIETDFFHHLHHYGINLVGRPGSGGQSPGFTGCQLVEKGLGHLRPTGILDAYEEYCFLFICHHSVHAIMQLCA